MESPDSAGGMLRRESLTLDSSSWMLAMLVISPFSFWIKEEGESTQTKFEKIDLLADLSENYTFLLLAESIYLAFRCLPHFEIIFKF